MTAARERVISDLRERIASVEGVSARKAGCLSFGVPEIDAVLPGGGLAYGALHEFAGGGASTVDGAAAALFAAGIADRPGCLFPADPSYHARQVARRQEQLHPSLGRRHRLCRSHDRHSGAGSAG